MSPKIYQSHDPFLSKASSHFTLSISLIILISLTKTKGRSLIKKIKTRNVFKLFFFPLLFLQDDNNKLDIPFFLSVLIMGDNYWKTCSQSVIYSSGNNDGGKSNYIFSFYHPPTISNQNSPTQPIYACNNLSVYQVNNCSLASLTIYSIFKN